MDIFGEYWKAKDDPEACRKSAEMVEKILALAEERAPGKKFNAILTGASGGMGYITALAIPKETLLVHEVKPWDMTLFGTTAGKISILTKHLPFFPDVAVVGWFDPDKRCGGRAIFPFTDYAVVHFNEVWPPK